MDRGQRVAGVQPRGPRAGWPGLLAVDAAIGATERSRRLRPELVRSLGYAAAMRAEQARSPRPEPAWGRTVATFYGAVVLVGFFWHGVGQDSNDIWRVDPEQDLATLLWTPAVGIVAGVLTVQGFRALQGRMAWLVELHREFSSIFGRPTNRELLLLAGASALGEEILFRGAMLDAWGLWISSLVFALLHIPPRASLWPWTVSAFIMGLGFGLMTMLTGNLGAAVAAHFVINLQNLVYITRNRPRLALGGPVRPVDVPVDVPVDAPGTRQT
jgi:membrane protease YdiL (CAAX protease family)